MGKVDIGSGGMRYNLPRENLSINKIEIKIKMCVCSSSWPAVHLVNAHIYLTGRDFLRRTTKKCSSRQPTNFPQLSGQGAQWVSKWIRPKLALAKGWLLLPYSQQQPSFLLKTRRQSQFCQTRSVRIWGKRNVSIKEETLFAHCFKNFLPLFPTSVCCIQDS